MERKTYSTITFKYGVINDLPDKYISDDGVEISLNKIQDNTISMVCSFEKAKMNKNEAILYTENLVRSISLITSVKLRVNSSQSINSKVIWEESLTNAIGNQAILGRSTIVQNINFEITGVMSINISSLSRISRYNGVMECFNNALRHYEASKVDLTAVAIWLRFTWEYLKLGDNEESLKNKILDAKLLSNKELKSFKFSIGKYYVHKESDSNISPVGIDQCIKYMQKILLYFIEK